MNQSTPAPTSQRLQVTVRGAVQGVGFRPFVFRLATDLALDGWVNNSSEGVFVEAEGSPAALQSFLLRLEREKPPLAFIQSLEHRWLDPAGYHGFEIRPSTDTGSRSTLVLPDIALCEDCRREILDPQNRRHFYPFTNCTNCGPRFSIINALPYDRANTSMRHFHMCPACQAEYNDAADRRFHAQPNACAVCGPQIALHNADGTVMAAAPAQSNRGILDTTAGLIRAGQIIAIRGLGGFHLFADATSATAIELLRQRKRREEKPFAVMFPDFQSIRNHCAVDELEERLLRSPECPIVLLRSLSIPLPSAEGSLRVHPSIAPGNPCIGALLPYTPLHELLMSLVGSPVVATSGNLSDEPICIDNNEAFERLRGIADCFLVHDRPIVRHVDDSIVRIAAGRELVLRRARGYAPLPVALRRPGTAILAVGAHLKNAVALSRDNQVFISQHLGDLETQPAHEAFSRAIPDLQQLLDIRPQVVAADLHPDYLSTRHAQQLARDQPQVQLVQVQHHVAHAFACLAENELDPPALAVSWDGTGLGTDHTVWGGEFILLGASRWQRFAHLRPFRLPGGDQAIKEPRRSALGVLFEMGEGSTADLRRLLPASAFTNTEFSTLTRMLAQSLNSPVTTSAGRLFDAVASLIDLRQKIRFEGQAAMELEFLADGCQTEETFPWPAPLADAPMVLDWSHLIREILQQAGSGVPKPRIAAAFHHALADAIVLVAQRAGVQNVLLTGGCFLNARLLERTIRVLKAAGFRPYWHQRVPPGDGGIALGQVAYSHWLNRPGTE